MSNSVDELRERAKALSDLDKLALVDDLLAQLDKPDPAIDRIWAQEAARRRRAYREGRLSSRSYDEVMKRFKNP
jgi:hypothetical protein